MENKEIFASNLNRYIKHSGKTVKDVANELDIAPTTFYSWTNAASYPRIHMIQKLADYFGILKSDLTEEYSPLVNKIIGISKLPFVGYGSCGNGAINEESVEWRDIPEWILGNKKNYDNYFLANAKGNSMERAGIKDGSLLIFFRQPELNTGDIGVFNLNGEEYVKRYSRQGNVIILNSEALTGDYSPIVVTEDDDFRIIAKLYKCIIDFE